MSEAITIRRVQDGVQYDHEIYVGEKRQGFYDSKRNRISAFDFTVLDYIQGIGKWVIVEGPHDALMLFQSAYATFKRDFPNGV